MNYISVELPASWICFFEPEDGSKAYYCKPIVETTTEFFLAYFVNHRFCALERSLRADHANIFKNLLEMFERAMVARKANGAIKQLEIPEELYEKFSNPKGLVDNLRLVDHLFFSFLSDDIGNDLDPEGYVNTAAATVKEMLFDLCVAIFSSYQEDILDEAAARLKEFDEQYPEVAAKLNDGSNND